MEPMWGAAMISKAKSLFTYFCCLQSLKEHWAPKREYWSFGIDISEELMRLVINVGKQTNRQKPINCSLQNIVTAWRTITTEKQMAVGSKNGFKNETSKKSAPSSSNLVLLLHHQSLEESNRASKAEICYTEFILKTTRQSVRGIL